MTLTTLVISVAIAALILTLIVGFAMRKVNNWLITYLQSFTGVLLVFSGWVKAIDPLGTAYKMEQYFAEFEGVFQNTWFSFMVDWFPYLSKHGATFAVSMIVLEIVLGIMLLLGSWRRFTAWAFLLLIVFFTFLTGFTHLTAYVPEGVSFFDFQNWGAYVETNMKVTDCGCFGDFLKLKPRISFYKDLALLVPAFIFIFFAGKMHQLFTRTTRTAIVWISIVAFTMYCLSNFVWGLPHTDFRPFKQNANIRLERKLETLASTKAEIEYKLTNKSSEEVVQLSMESYLEQYKNYPKEEWDIEQIKKPKVHLVPNEDRPSGYDLEEMADNGEEETELINYLKEKWSLSGDPAVKDIERSKVSDFDISDIEGEEVSEALLSDPNYSFMVVAYKLYGDIEQGIAVITDTIFQVDTISLPDTTFYVKKLDHIDKRQVTKDIYRWTDEYTQPWTEKVNPVLEAAEADGYNTYAVTGYEDPSIIDDFRHATQSAYPFYMADDILLKTIVRSNPGVVLLKNGEVIKKWHHLRLPDYETIKRKYLQ